MRPASSRVVTLWITVLCLLTALCSLNPLASAEAAKGSKRKLAKQHATAVGSIAVARAKNPGAPPLTTDTWQGGASGSWDTSGNWSAGVPNSGDAVTIGLSSATVSTGAAESAGTLTLSNSGDILNISNNTSLTMSGNITNNGQINLNSSNNPTELVVGVASVALSGTGTLNMGNNANNIITGAATTDTLNNSSTIQGSGNIGNGTMTLINSGTIDATQSNVLNVDANGGTTNTGTLEATTGTLILYGNGGTNTITNTNGTIKSTGSDVQLQSGVIINGGTLTTTGSGLIHSIGGQSATLENLTISSSSNYQLDNNSTTNLIGTITNNGNINLASSNNETAIELSTGNVTLAGTGNITTSNNANNWVFGAAGTDTLTIGSGQKFSGSGDIGFEPGFGPSLTLINNGTIDAIQSNPLFIQTSGGTTNTGTLEATTGTLILYGSTVTQTGAGNILSSGSDVQLQNGVNVSGGVLNTSGSGLIHSTGGQTATLTTLTNAGNYQVDNNSTTNLVGTITNNGNMNLQSINNFTAFGINGSVSLNGTGTVTMTNNANNYIYGVGSSNTLTVGGQQTISGSGIIGGTYGTADMALVNNGVIDANQPTALYIQATGTTNNKTLEATAGGTLILDGNTVTNTSGTITAATGSGVDLTAVTINGGILSTSGTGLIHTESGQVATLENLTISSASNYQVDNNSTTIAIGTIVNNGNINLASINNATEFQISGNVTLNGTGTLTMSNNANNYILGASGSGTEVLTNNITISGSGNFGNGELIVNNTSLGTIDANQPNALSMNPSIGGVTNTGLMEATAGGTLNLNNGTYTNKVGSTSGTILANGGTVNLNSSATIVGGTLQSENGGVIQNTATATLDGSTSVGAVTLVAGSTLNVLNNTALDIKGSIVNNGTLQLLSSNNATELVVAGVGGSSATLSGTGTLVMSNNTNNFIFGAAGTNTFINQETIQGSGVIGDNQLILVNNGTINANQTNSLTINPSGGTTNTGILEATATGTLNLANYPITNTGANIEANGATGAGNGATVNLENGVTITGGTLSSNQFGSFNVLNTATLSGLTLNGTVNIENNTALTVVGTIVNNGTIALGSSNNATELILSGNVALSGTGTVTMSNNANNFIFGGAGTDVLTVANTQTIQGSGNIGDNQMVLTNNGTINANQSNALVIQASGGATNTATMEATSGGTMILNGDTVTNTGAGTIMAGTGSGVTLENNVNVTGGSLTGAGTFTDVNSATLSGLTNASTFAVNNTATLTLIGTITNNGTIDENSSNNTTEILLSGNVTLKGTGTLVMSNNINNYIFGLAGTDVLTNSSTIEGAGHIGNGQMGLVNSGTILANDSNALAINVSGTVNNTGIFESTSSGGLTVTAPTGNFLNYTSSNNTLTGGSYIANGGNITLPLGTSGGITTLAASVTEENGGQIFNSNNSNANALNGLTGITSAGALTIGGVAFVDSGAFSNAGSLTILAGESFKVGSLTQISGGSLTAGTYVLDANLALTGATQTITTNAANLTLAGGTIENANSTNALAGLSTNTGKLTIGGASNNLSTTASSFSNTGTLTINGGDSFTAGNLAQISGSTLSGGTFILGGNLDLTTTGINITTNATTLTLQGGTIMSGSANALAALATNSGKLTIGGTSNAVSTSVSSFSNTGTLTINATDSFTATTLTQLTGPNNNKTLASGTYVLGGNLDLTTSGLSITKNNANLTLEGGTINSNFANALGALATNAGHLTIAGTGVNVSTTAASFSNTGTLTIDAGDSFSAPALTQISGSTLSGGTFILGGNLDLTAAANITTNSSVLTLEGGTIKTGSTNDLANLSSNTDSLTLASNASFTATGNFTNTGALTVNKGSTFTLTGTNVLTNLSSGTLSGGTYTIGGTLQLTSTNGSIKTNAANLTLTGTAAKIHDGSANALATFNNNTGTFALANGATLTTSASSNFSNSGTVTVNKGTTMTVGGSGHNYNQTAGTSTVDGTLTGTSITATGGTVQGAGTLVGNTSIGNATGAAATLNVGDSGTTGLLAITGGYTQLATGNMTGLINGTTAGTGFSQINITGTAALGGTINFTVAAAFQSSLFLGETFTVLNAGTVTGNFTNTTIAINSNFHFAVSYTGTSVVLTVASGPVGTPNSNSAQPAAALVATAKSATATSARSKTGVVMGGLRHVTSGAVRSAKPVMVAGMAQPAGRSNALLGRGSELMNLPTWKQMPIISTQARPVAVAQPWRAANETASHVNAPASDLHMGQSHVIPVQPVAGWMNGNRRAPVEVVKPLFPRIAR